MNAADVERVTAAARAVLGRESRLEIGEITRLAIQRFAIAIGDDDPLHLDPEHARRLGYADVVAPPTMLPSVLVWDAGPAEPGLRVDGTVPDTIVPTEGFRRMGGGQRLEFVAPVVAGDRLTIVRKLVDVTTKEAKSGMLILLVTEKRFVDAQGRTRIVCTETSIIR